MGLNVKYILILFFFICTSFGAKANVRTLEIGSLYYQCKIFQDVDFDFEKLSQLGQVNAMICKTTLIGIDNTCLLYTSPSPRDSDQSRMPSSA